MGFNVTVSGVKFLPSSDLKTCDVATIDALLAVAPCSPFLALLQENTLLNTKPSTVIGIVTVPLSARVPILKLVDELIVSSNNPSLTNFFRSSSDIFLTSSSVT